MVYTMTVDLDIVDTEENQEDIEELERELGDRLYQVDMIEEVLTIPVLKDVTYKYEALKKWQK